MAFPQHNPLKKKKKKMWQAIDYFRFVNAFFHSTLSSNVYLSAAMALSHCLGLHCYQMIKDGVAMCCPCWFYFIPCCNIYIWCQCYVRFHLRASHKSKFAIILNDRCIFGPYC